VAEWADTILIGVKPNVMQLIATELKELKKGI
jgi:hypothetical protein